MRLTQTVSFSPQTGCPWGALWQGRLFRIWPWPRWAEAWPGNESCGGRGQQANRLAHPAFGSGLDGGSRALRAPFCRQKEADRFRRPAKNESVDPAGDGASIVSVIECRAGPGPASARWLRAVSAGRASCWPHHRSSTPGMLTCAFMGRAPARGFSQLIAWSGGRLVCGQVSEAPPAPDACRWARG